MLRATAAALVVTLSLASCKGRGAVPPSTSAAQITLIAAYDLPRDDARTRELSGIAWEAKTRTLFAISDTVPEIVPLHPSDDYRAWSIGEPIALHVPEAWDGEGIVLTERGFLVADERGPHIYAVDRKGALESELALPASYARCVRNKALESLSTTEDGRYLFTANESTLDGDSAPPTTTRGATVRILRRDLRDGTNGSDVEYAYRTDPIFAEGARSDMGVSEILALSKNDILVMERSFVPGVGNSVRIYRTNLEKSESAEIADSPELSASARVLSKSLFLDFAALPGSEIAGEGEHHFPNYEGLALGPRLGDGRRIVFVVSDDNANPALVTRVLTLGVSGL